MPNLSIDPGLLKSLMPSRDLCHAVLADCLSIKRPSDAPFLLPEHFPMSTDCAVWRAMLELDKAGLPIEQITLKQMLLRDPSVSDVSDGDWDIYFAHVNSEPNHHSALTFEEDARFIFDCALRLRKARELEEQIGAVLDLTQPLPESGLTIGAKWRFTPHTAKEVFETIPDANWIVEGLLAPCNLVMVYGESDSKKTYSMCSVAAHVLKGVDWLRFKTRAARVLIVDEESGDRRLRLRLRECFNAVGLDPSCDGLTWLTMERIKVDDPECAAALEAFIAEVKPELVIVDSLAEVTSGDENSKEYMKPAMSKLRGIAERQKLCMLFIHHSAKYNGVFRGSTAIKDSLDQMIHVESKRGQASVHYTLEKNRDGETFDWYGLAKWKAVEGAPEKNEFCLERVEGRKEEGQEKRMGAKGFVLEHLREKGVSALPTMIECAQAKFSESGIRKAVGELQEAGEIRRTNPDSGNTGKTMYFELSPSESEE